MKDILIIAYILLVIISSTVYSQQDWTGYQKNIVDDITAIAVEDTKVWIGTPNGLVEYNKTTGVSIAHTVDDGLVNNEINSIAIDHEGVKWIATNNGISRFDGTIWTSYQDTVKLSSLEVLDVAVDNNNIKWFISKNSVSTFDGERWTVFTQENGLPANFLTKIAVDKNNKIWIGTVRQGIISYDGLEWKLHNEYWPKVVSMAVDNNNTVWFGDYSGSVVSFDGNEWSTFPVISSLWHLYSVDTDSKGVLWVGTQKGLFKIKDGKKEVFLDEDGLNKSTCNIVKIGDDDVLWIAGHHNLTKFDGIHFEENLCYTGPNDISFYEIVIDHENVIWFGHMTDKISCIDGNAWRGFTIDGYNLVGEGIAVSPDNVIWFTAGFDGVLYFDGISLNKLPLLSYNHPYYPDGRRVHFTDITVDYNNGVYLSYGAGSDPWEFPGGIMHFVYDSSVLKSSGINVNNRISFPNLRDSNAKTARWWISTKFFLCIDSRNFFWIADQIIDSNNNGLSYRYNNSIVEIPTEITSVVMVYNIYSDSNDTIWIPSDNGIYFYDGNKVQNYTTENSGLVNDTTLSVAVDVNQTLWIGTDFGVSRFDGESWTTLKTSNSGLCDNKVNAIAVEKNNTIWFGTDNGVSSYTGEVITTSVDEEDEIPEALPVIQSYPNPFNPSTTIEFTLPESGFTTLAIYNISGQKVRELAADYMASGAHSLTWDGRDGSGDAVSSGVYITRLVAGKQVAAGRMILLK